MRAINERTRVRTARLVIAALLAASVAALPATSSAAPSKRQQRIERFRQQVAEAKAKLDALNQRESIADEQYLQAKAALDQTQLRLAGARRAARSAGAAARTASRDLARRARAAYEGSGSSLGLLLGASSFGEFSDRLEFMNQMAADDTAAVDRANVAGQRATWATAALRSALGQRRAALAEMVSKRDEVRAAVAAQEHLLGSVQEKLRVALIPPPPPPPPLPTSNPTPPSGGRGGGGPAPPPPPAPSPRAGEALRAAYSVLGVRYTYAGASPETGFDCSGLTMWSWAHAGVSLPHSSAMQYAVLPHVDRSQLQPGDLLFFYTPIHHVAMYVGGGRMIHAPHTGGVVEVIPVYWQYYVGAARPG
jgi:peptidoglycan DL-endopeptidase CwlO